MIKRNRRLVLVIIVSLVELAILIPILALGKNQISIASTIIAIILVIVATIFVFSNPR